MEVFQIIKISNVNKRYGEFEALKNINIDIEKGEIIGIIGGNGAGKTTTFRTIMGLIQPTSGEIIWKEEINKENEIGYLPEERGLYPKSKIKDQLIYLASLRGMNKKEAVREIDYWLEKFNITNLKNKKASELSKGNQQKVQFIYAVMHKPKLLILDEPFSGLDPVNAEMLKKAIKEVKNNGTTILFSSHRMENVEELCEKIVIYKKGEVIEQGKISDLKEKYGTNKIIVKTKNKLIIPKEKIEKVENVKENIELTIKNKEKSQEIIKEIVSKNEIQKIEIKTLTLNEIFIRLVGEDYE